MESNRTRDLVGSPLQARHFRSRVTTGLPYKCYSCPNCLITPGLKAAYSSSWKTHRRATERHLPSDTGESFSP